MRVRYGSLADGKLGLKQQSPNVCFGSEAEARSGQHRIRGLGPANGHKQRFVNEPPQVAERWYAVP
jgi:hypothetical protein